MAAGAMSRWSRDKGARIEREVVAAHAELGIKAERVPLSGAARYRGNGADVDLYVFGPDAAPIVCEVKARASGEGFATLERWLGDADALFLRRDRADPLVVLPWQTWARLVPGMARYDRGEVRQCAGRGGGVIIAHPGAEWRASGRRRRS
jgi:Holliday junction resolvase